MSRLVAKHEVGQLDQRVILKRQTLADDGMGGDTLTLNPIDTVWANVRPMSGAERQRFERLDAESMYTFTIRNRSDLSLVESDRIEWQGVDYNIRFIASYGPRELYVSINAEKGVAQ